MLTRTRTALLLLLLLPGACTPAIAPQSLRDDTARGVTIVRDEWGVPTIYGPTAAAVAFGLGFAQAEDNFRQLEEEYLHVLGRAAAYYGDAYYAADLVAAAFEVERLSREEYQREPPERRAIWDAFAAGINHYLSAHGVRPRALARFEPWMPFARFRAVRAGTTLDGVHLGGASDDARRASAARAAASQPTLVGARIADAPDSSARDPHPAHAATMWAVAPARTAGGHALLFQHADSALFGSAQPYELHLHSDDGWHVRGFAALGTPVPISAHNEHLGWSHTLASADIADVYEVTFDHPSDPLLYRYDGDWRQAAAWTDTLFVNTASGVEPRVHTFVKTHHGPVVAREGGKALAVRIARHEQGGALQQWYALGRAASLQQFRAALALTSFTTASTLYADRAGHIFYLHGNAVPVRDPAFDWSRPVDGSTPRTEWQGYHPLDDLPQLLDPPAGWLQNAGSSPFLVTVPEQNPDPARFPAYIAAHDDNARARASRRILQRDSLWTLEQWSAAVFDSHVGTADTAIAALVHDWEQIGATDPARAMRIDEPLDRLRAWDRISTTTSPEMTLFTLWQLHLRLSEDTARFHRFRAFEDVLARLRRDWDTTLVAWGELNRLQRVHTPVQQPFRDDRTSESVRGGPGALGLVFAYEAEEVPGSRRRYGARGQTAVGVVELGPAPAARTVVTFGQSGDTASAHYFDQAPLYARGELKRAWFARADVMAHARRVYEPVAARTVR